MTSSPIDRVEAELDAHAADQVDLAAQDVLRQAVIGQRVAEHAAGVGPCVEDGDLVARHRQIEGRGQAGGPAPTTATVSPVGASLWDAMRATILSKRSDR